MTEPKGKGYQGITSMEEVTSENTKTENTRSDFKCCDY